MNQETYRIIDGKRYNRDTAERVAKYWNGLADSDFNQIYEQLYRTPKGAWFLIGEGGALSPYAQSCGNMAGAGTQWVVLSAAEAFGWLEEHGETEALEQYFPDQIQEA